MKTVTLTGITWKNPRGYDPLVEASRSYENKTPDINIKWEQYPWYEFEHRILDDFKNKTGIYDIIMFDHPWTGTLCKNGWLLPWDDYLPNTYFRLLRRRVVPPSVESYNYKGKQWALPLDAASHCALYQKAKGLETTLPVHWEDIKDWATEAQKMGYKTPLVLSLQGVLGSCLFLSMMAAYGKPAFSNPEEENIHVPTAEYILTLLKELQVYCPPKSSKWAPWDIYEKFSANKDLLYSPSLFAYVNYLGTAHNGKQLHISRVPIFSHNKKSKAIIGGVGLGLTRSCRNIKAAVDYGTYLMSDLVQKEIFPIHNGQPAFKAVWEDDSINETVNNFYKDLKPNMDNGYIRPRYNGFHDVELAIGQTLQKWWDNEHSIGLTIKKLNEIKPIL